MGTFIKKGGHNNIVSRFNRVIKSIKKLYREMTITNTKGNSICKMIKIIKSSGRRGKGKRL